MLMNRKTVAELLALNPMKAENTKYTCQAKLVEIDTTYGWWYKACYDCKGGVKDYDGTFWCNQCGKNDQSPLNAIVADETGSANFTIFGKTAQDLIRVPAQQLATAINSNRFILPPIIKNVVGQTFIFQVSLESRKFNTTMQSFRVTKIFQSALTAKIKIEEKEEDVIDITEDGATTSPKELQIASKSYLEEAVKESRGKRRVLSYIESSESEEEK
uniref:Replication factor A C-terminal domain-containing protein n=1 Tax=Ananas comosus var. bracteatus TaxID=296719 RepID=A0A6V7QRH1_ANACO